MQLSLGSGDRQGAMLKGQTSCGEGSTIIRVEHVQSSKHLILLFANINSLQPRAEGRPHQQHVIEAGQ